MVPRVKFALKFTCRSHAESSTGIERAPKLKPCQNLGTVAGRRHPGPWRGKATSLPAPVAGTGLDYGPPGSPCGRGLQVLFPGHQPPLVHRRLHLGAALRGKIGGDLHAPAPRGPHRCAGRRLQRRHLCRHPGGRRPGGLVPGVIGRRKKTGGDCHRL